MSAPNITMSRSQFEQLVRGLVAEELAQFFEMTTITRASEDDDERQDVVRLYEDDDGEPGTIDLARHEAWGDIGIPPDKEPAIILRRGDQGVLFPVTSGRYRPRGFKKGDRVIFSSAVGTRVVLRGDSDSATAGQVEVQTPSGTSLVINKDGEVTLKTAAGQAIKIEAGAGADVVVNQGTAAVARDGENVKPTAAMAKVVAAAVVAANLVAPGTISPAEATELGLVIGNVDGGAGNFKG